MSETPVESTSPHVPRHVAIIMDGNGRWAKERGLPRVRGHEEGANSVRTVIRSCRDHGVEFLTLYAFSVENWKRPKNEIRALMRLLRHFLKRNEYELHENRVRLRVIGRRADLPDDVQRELIRVERATEHYTEGQLLLALSYGGRTELVDAMRGIAERVREGELEVEQIDEAQISASLYAPDVPDPDLLIRTSGEMRLSNFLLWQLSYTEIYVTDTLWPDFRGEAFAEALKVYGDRDRRYGGVKSGPKEGSDA